MAAFNTCPICGRAFRELSVFRRESASVRGVEECQRCSRKPMHTGLGVDTRTSRKASLVVPGAREVRDDNRAPPRHHPLGHVHGAEAGEGNADGALADPQIRDGGVVFLERRCEHDGTLFFRQSIFVVAIIATTTAFLPSARVSSYCFSNLPIAASCVGSVS
eukprot:CAMPEP_0171805132 /NCGR_PEP_ID=MMETSP0991-20121206/74515_1 /TAXON_ID=483369 /ORGANISM="non described non described, Strain CCMP2098" /LENGTH=161 /DNA_ID=CAMNT_0012417619 /DNA_START=187 /DNA_END=672 /DNA_ORIENTATION=-